MSTLLQWFGSAAWLHLVQALLHTLWIGALLAAILFLILRRTVNPFLRYRCSLLALTAVLFGGLVVWSWLEYSQGPVPRSVATRPAPGSLGAPASLPASAKKMDGTVPWPGTHAEPALAPEENHNTPYPALRSGKWAAWLALGWLLGAAVMLVRVASSVVQAEKLRGSTRPLADEAVLRLVQEARRRLEITRRIRVAMTDKLTSPAVVGVMVPTLILPLSLLTAVPAGQLQLILLHELAHIRRGDYVANLFQFIIESLLFFNPAIWWLSRQTRLEREACCDALAAGLAEDRVAYARALAHVAEQVLRPGTQEVCPAAAAAMADRRQPSALRDRLQRLLVPGYRPSLRLTWKALAGWLILGSALLLLSALGTQWTVRAAARLLTPQQRIARIETAMKDMGQAPDDFTGKDDLNIPVAIKVRTPDGSPLLENTHGIFHLQRRNSSYTSGARPDKDGVFRISVQRGMFHFGARVEGYAPVCLGPLNLRASNEVENVELTLEPGFNVHLKAVDGDTGAPLADALITGQFWMPQGPQYGGAAQELTTDADGAATLDHCGPLRLSITVAKDGYETVEQRFDAPKPDSTLKLTTRRAVPLAGLVKDKLTGQPVPEAEIFVLRAENAPGLVSRSPDSPGSPLATTDGRGFFQVNSLPRSGRYWLLVRAEGHADIVLGETQTGQTNLEAALGPELRVRGRLAGDLNGLPRSPRGPEIGVRNTYQTGNNSFGTYKRVPVHLEDETASFEFISPIAGPLTLVVGERSFTREVTAPVQEWLVDLSPEKTNVKTREVTLRFQHPSGVPPKGTVAVLLPGQDPHTATRKEMEIRDGAVSFEIPVGREFSYEPAHTVGYWFDRQYGVKVADGSGRLVIPVPIIPAGAIYAQARKADGVLAGNVSFSVRELKRSPLAKEGWPTTPNSDSWSPDGGPRQYVASPLPLGGTYLVIASQTNTFAVSEPIQLTDAAPDRKIELQFKRGAPITGQVLSPAGQPLPRAKVDLSWGYREYGAGLQPCLTDENGRFAFEDCLSRLGQYTIALHSPGCRSVSLPINFAKLPVTVRLEPGLKLSGRVIEAKSGRPVLSAQVRVWADSGKLPTETTMTDEKGNFSFDTLSDTQYHLFVDGYNYPSTSDAGLFKPGAQPLLLKMTVVPGATVRLGPDRK